VWLDPELPHVEKDFVRQRVGLSRIDVSQGVEWAWDSGCRLGAGGDADAT